MASSSSSSIPKSFKYDVFLSFRGADTRKDFADYLYSALQQQGIHVYKGDVRISIGRKLPDELIRSIKESKFFIIVFSKNYASSAWCLEELVTIMECHKTAWQTAYPVFYDVEPSEVRKQIGAVGKAFAKHHDNEAAGKWRRALKEAADLAGWELKNTADGHEAKFIQRIVEEISLELRPINFSYDKKLVGLESRVKDVLSSLETGFGDVRMIGIKGMGGIGKTTLARAIFDQVSSQFEGKSFVQNVREISNASLLGLKSLQTQVLVEVLADWDIPVSSIAHGIAMIKRMMPGKKVLVVLDDVDHIEQLEALAGSADWFGEGSRIIITTRDEQVLVAHGVKHIYNVDLLSDEEAICLFSRYAFGRESPVQGYAELSLQVVRYAAGLPLTITVLGSFLCGKDELEWVDVVRRLRTIPLQETLNKLELSYTGLEGDFKEIFLDVACFMKGLPINDAIRILESCGFHARMGLRVLQQKSLLTISNDRLGMHIHIEEMGRNIVRRSHPDKPNQHSRLWIQEEIEDILANDLGTEAIRGIRLSELRLSPNIVMRGFRSLKELRCLIVESETGNDDLSSDWKFDEDMQYFSNALRIIRWVKYPFLSLPGTFRANNLVALEMPCSRITQLWEGGEKKVLNKLRFLDLSYSMLKILDLGMTPNLERLDLKECHNLTELHVPLGCLQRLVYLNLIGCSRFKSFLFIKQLESLKLLSLPKLEVIVESSEEFPRYSRDNLPKLRFTCFYLEEQASSIENGQNSFCINLQPRTKLESVLGSICGLQHLKNVTFNGCIPEVPEDLDRLAYLEKFNLVSTNIKWLPVSICVLKHLKSLKLKSCELLEELPENLGLLECLEELSLLSTGIRRLPDSICMLKQLKFLKLKSCLYLAQLPEDLGRLKCLEKLNLLSAHIKHLPDSICMLKHLKSLELESCRLLEKLPVDLGKLECLEKLILTKCASLVDIPISICNMKRLRCFHLPFCLKVEKLPEELGRLECLKELNVKFTGISHLPQSISSLIDLRVVGSEAVLQSCAFATQIQTSETETFCYIQAMDKTSTDRIQRLESIPLMASSTTSSIHKSFKYDVFLSFRAEDTSDTFVHNLYAALQRQGTHTYMDDWRMRHGRKIDEEVIRSIQHSKFFIIVFSKYYATSSWCLDELVKIIECHKTTKHTAYCVFYDVDPSEIRNQIGAVGEDDGKWGQALEDATELAGWNMRNTTDGNEATFIEKIVEDIWLQLWSINVYINSKIIGMEPQIEEVLSSSGPGVGDVRMIGITGMGGVGKTTLARAIFDRVSFRFEGTSFVKNVREVSKADLSGLHSLQEQVLSDVLANEDITVTSVFEGKNMIEKELGDRQVLVVLDDVNQIEQLEALAGAANWFGKGSIIIITTSYEEMLLKHGVKQIHRVHALPEDEALCLFSWFAFGGGKPVEGYEQLSLEVVHCAAGLPLAIKVLGSFLRGKTEIEWIVLIQRLKVISLDEGLKLLISFETTLEKLEFSYISLENENKEIFLDIVCFMKGLRENDATRILESCGFHAKDGLRVLLRKSLLTLSDDRCLGMHDYIEYMGRNIVRRVHPNQPNRHSRLWIREEIEDILAKDLGTEATEVIQLSEPKLSPGFVMEGVERMKKLRCLIVESENDDDDLTFDWEFDEVRQYFPNALRFLRWVYYPVQSLPITFRADNLVALEMPDSRITQLWEGGERQVLHNLRFLDLSRSMLMTLDLELTPGLECLELRECHDLVDLLTPAGSLTRLVHLDLTDCSKFNSIMFIKRLESPQILSLSKLHLIAKPLKEFSWSHPNIPRLEFKCLYSEEQTSLKSVSLNLKRSTKLESFSGSICGLQHLRHLTLDGGIPEVPKDIDQLAYLQKLKLLYTRIKCLPDSICVLKHLKSLKLKSCELLEGLPENFGWLKCLEELSLSSTGIICLPDSICRLERLKSLKLKSCSFLERLPEGLGRLQCLEKLNLLSSRIKCLPDSICMLERLKSLELEYCGSLMRLPEDLGKLDSLEKLILTECMSLVEIPNSICNVNNLKQFHLPFCDKVKELPEELGRVKCLRELNVKGTGIRHLPLSISLVEGLRIVGSVAVLKSCAFAPEIQNSEDETFCYIPVKLRVARRPTEGVSSSRMI